MKTIQLFPQKLTVTTGFLRGSVNKALQVKLGNYTYVVSNTAIRLPASITLLLALICFAIKKENNLVSPFLNFFLSEKTC